MWPTLCDDTSWVVKRHPPNVIPQMSILLLRAALRTLHFRAEAGVLELAHGANLDFSAACARVAACSPLRPDVHLDVDLASGCVREVAGGGEAASGAPRRAPGSGRSGGGGDRAEPWAEEALAPGAAGRPGLAVAPGTAAHAPMAASRGGRAGSSSGGGSPMLTFAPRSAAARSVSEPDSSLGSSPDPRSARVRKHCHGGFVCWVERVRAADGALVPLTVARSAAAGEPGPALLAVYGAYGLPLDLSYRPEHASLLVRLVLSLG